MDWLDRPSPQAVESERRAARRAAAGSRRADPRRRAGPPRGLLPPRAQRPVPPAGRDARPRTESIEISSPWPSGVTRGDQAERFGGAGYVAELPEHVPSTANLTHYAEVIREKASLRELIRVSVDSREPGLRAALRRGRAHRQGRAGHGVGRRRRDRPEVLDSRLSEIRRRRAHPDREAHRAVGHDDRADDRLRRSGQEARRPAAHRPADPRRAHPRWARPRWP